MWGKEKREQEKNGWERESEPERDRWMGKQKRERTERRSGQARDAWLESGQAHMRPPSYTLSTKKVV